jgi:type I restriction enzyme M protein
LNQRHPLRGRSVEDEAERLPAALASHKGRDYDPCRGSGEMFVSGEKFIEAHGNKIGDISIYGQRSTL